MRVCVNASTWTFPGCKGLRLRIHLNISRVQACLRLRIHLNISKVQKFAFTYTLQHFQGARICIFIARVSVCYELAKGIHLSNFRVQACLRLRSAFECVIN